MAATLDLGVLRAEIRLILPSEDLASTTLGKLRVQLEKSLGLCEGALEAQKDAVNAVVHEELLHFLQANAGGDAEEDDAEEDAEEEVRLSKKHKKQKKTMKKSKKRGKLSKKEKAGDYAAHNLNPAWLTKHLGLQTRHLDLKLNDLPVILRGCDGMDISDSESEEQPKFASPAVCKKAAPEPSPVSAEAIIALSPTPLRFASGLSKGLPSVGDAEQPAEVTVNAD
mmetsp:Transcript_85365/g.219834  ORF Transcript_85365/g.219834 Transcript_85365/m.219834 type:complete len:225 (+) Transcript_85365:63-737(+)